MKIKDGLNPVSQIDHFAIGKLDSFLGTIGEDDEYKDPIYRGVRSTTQQIASDYGRRFLIELVQNAYDAHPIGEQSGEISIYFAPNEDYSGVLYVANRGIGFNWSNVKALSNVGLSDKPAGENIGNKGLGFRSVLFISDDPQIYSRLSSGPSEHFDGYCFRFARSNDFEELIKNPAHVELAKNDIPDFHIPLPLAHQPDRVVSFSRQGFVTVIRLPLRDDSKRQVVYEELEALSHSPTPVILFLQKINTLNGIVEDAHGRSFTLGRKSEDVQIDASTKEDYKFSVVSLGNDQKYFIGWHWISEDEVKKAIRLSIDQKELHPRWKDWQGVGELAVAVRLDDAPITPLLYTFLPMGKEAEGPFYGYLHAAFYPKADRTSLHGDIPINALYIKKAIELCARTIIAVRSAMDRPDFPFTKEDAGKIIIDLLSWEQCKGVETKDNEPFPVRMGNAFSNLGKNLMEIDILPTITRKSNVYWAQPGQVWRWHKSDLKAFSAEALVERADIPILLPHLGEERLDRLTEFFKKSNNLNFGPHNENLADAIEKVASYLLRTRASMDKWREFYQELEPISQRCYLLLRSKKFILCMGGELLPAMQGATGSVDGGLQSSQSSEKRRRGRTRITGVAIFSPPARGSEEVLQLPERFRKSFAFLSDQLDWYGELNFVREFLEEKKFIGRYDGQELINQVSRVLREEKSKKIRRLALTWTFRLYQKTRHDSRPLSFKEARLFVPTVTDEWIEAKEALFSRGWPEKTLGPLINDFLNLTVGLSPELQGLKPRLIEPPDEIPFSSRPVNDWVDFLIELGVQSGLKPILRETRNFKISGLELSANKICQRLGIGEGTLKYWENEIQKSGKRQIYPNSVHELSGNIWYLPGQDHHEHFSDEARFLYAQLLLRWMESAQPECLDFAFFPPIAKYAGRFSWPTPLAAFLRQAPWFPIEISDGLQAISKFCKPAEVWFPEEIGERLPPFIPQIPKKILRILAQESLMERLLEWCGVNVLNSSASLAKQVDFLGRLFATSDMGYHASWFVNLYYVTWHRLARMGTEWIASDRPSYLIVRHRGKHVAFPLQKAQSVHPNPGEDIDDSLDKEVYVQDTEQNLKSDLLEKLGFPIFGAEGMGTPGIIILMRGILGERFRAISEVPLLLLIDGSEIEDIPDQDNFLVNLCPWMPTIVCLAMESLTSKAAQSLPADRTKILERLDRILVRLARKVEFQINGKIIQLPDSYHGAVAFGGEERPTLIIGTESGSLDWDALTHAAAPICQHLKQADLAQAIRNACRALERCEESVSGPITSDSWLRELCPELGLEVGAASKSLKLLGSNIHRLLKFLRPVVHFLNGPEGERTFSSHAAQVTTVPELSKALAPHLEGTQYTLEAVLNACQRAMDFSQLREELTIPFAEFNQSLIAVGLEPEKHEEAHKDAVKTYTSEHRDQIMDCLRSKFREAFEQGQPLTAYCNLRANIDHIDPKEEWLLKYPVPDPILIRSLINEWLSRQGAPALGAQIALSPWSEVRRRNKAQVNRLVQSATNTIRAWSLKNNAAIPTEWGDTSTAREQVFNCLDKLGALDFKPLDPVDLIFWLLKAEAWPNGMPATITLEDLGLTRDDLDVEQKRENDDRIQQEKIERSIEFNGRIIDPNDVVFDTLLAEIEEKLTPEIISTKLGVLTSLKLIGGSPGLGKSGGGGGGGGRPRKINQDKSRLIGFLGECAVYHWLKKQFPQQDIDAAWVSTYKSRILPEAGNDSLGYDFKIRYRNQQWYLEVKSRIGDPREFELGETEVSFASNCVRKKGEEYRIIYLSNIQDTSAMRLEVLPNPFSDEGKGLRRVGQGLRYRF
ncbi:MAG: sacsin N-terminal ATP-binding-like domain-containing protein [Desulfobaccales bacterium]